MVEVEYVDHATDPKASPVIRIKGLRVLHYGDEATYRELWISVPEARALMLALADSALATPLGND